ncbi:pyridoxamine 5'-phosphate oxidase family protein [Rugosimonospora acidiphila]|uniref:Pyridoxamine 5'-phosphate oxidase family protein n=1 Tax=Rugosimonospora acidiphila TaxID=556531 RepID=A0ABP9S803_9ACTN
MVSGFHEGELAIQARARVVEEASRLAGMLDNAELSGGFRRFLAEKEFAAVTARDPGGRLWISPLFAHPGFLDTRDGILQIHAVPRPGDPLAALRKDQPVGLVVMDFATRRRVRINGVLVGVGADSLRIEVEQAYGNCPQYIQQRQIRHIPQPGSEPGGSATPAATPADTQVRLIQRSDTFFLGTAHPTRGADASHRGGRPGFVRTFDGDIWWPDYPGNNMFNSLGNLAVNDEAALLFLDFDTGSTLHLSGTARVEWIGPGMPGDDGHTGRRVRFSPVEVVRGPTLDLTADQPRFSPFDPPLT